MIELFFRVLNGLITLYIFYLLHGFYDQTKKQFYRFWSAGFFFYGANIILRIFVPVIELNPLGMLAFLLNTAGFILMMTGIGELVSQGRKTLIITILIQLSLVFIVVRLDSELLAWVMLLAPHVLIILSLGYINIRFKVKIGTIILGWTGILVANAALSANLLGIIYVDLISTISKVVVFRGMSQPTFSFLAEDLRSFILGGLPAEFSEDHVGGFNIINLGSSKAEEIKWIKKRVNQNDKRGVRTIIFNFYDLLNPALFSEETKKTLYMVRIIAGRREFMDLFENQVITINDDPSLIQIVLKDIIKASRETTVPTEIIVYSLSNAIISHGWSRIYSIILSNNPELKDSSVSISCFFYPGAHSDASIVAKFLSIADKIYEK